jgi:hypothetical protein
MNILIPVWNLMTKIFLFTEMLDTAHWSGKGSLMKHKFEHLGGFKVDWLKNNPFEYLRNKNFIGKDHFLHNERTFIKATQEEETSLFWQYIENLFWFQNAENDDVRKKFENILMKPIGSKL